MGDNDDERAMAIVVLQYDLTEDLADAIGGAAPQVQKMLVKAGNGVRVARAGLVLDVEDVNVQFKADGWELGISHTKKLKVKVKSPNAEDTGPTLEAHLAFGIDDDEPLLFLRANLGQLVKIKMLRRQLELLPAEEKKEAAE
jgi:hypothetical protein